MRGDLLRRESERLWVLLTRRSPGDSGPRRRRSWSEATTRSFPRAPTLTAGQVCASLVRGRPLRHASAHELRRCTQRGAAADACVRAGGATAGEGGEAPSWLQAALIRSPRRRLVGRSMSACPETALRRLKGGKRRSWAIRLRTSDSRSGFGRCRLGGMSGGVRHFGCSCPPRA